MTSGEPGGGVVRVPSRLRPAPGAGPLPAAIKTWRESSTGWIRAEDPDAAALGYDAGRIRAARTDCLLRQGRWETAYDEGPSPDEAFEVAARYLDAYGSADDLAQLIERHRGRASTVRNFPYWRAAVLWKRDAYAEALPLLDEYLGAPEGPGQYMWDAVERKFLGLLQVGRVDEARRFLEEPLAARHPKKRSWEALLADAAGDDVKSPPPGVASR